ncbi:MAG: hypothetical protein CMM98_04335 [Rickettsiales bacterium]|nr:hypothetical protein [Rickettsiales bacterium]
MNLNFYIELLSLISFFVFLVTNFINIETNSKINKIIYLSNLLFISFVNVIYYNFIILNPVSVLSLVTTLLLIIFFLCHFFISIFSTEYVRLRLLFLPFFLILLLFRFLISLNTENQEINYSLFDNTFLLVHIFSSLFSYSMLTISAISSVCVFLKSKILKQVRFNDILLNLLPSIYESEIISIRFLFFTMFFLTLSLFSGFYYHFLEYSNFDYFFNDKAMLSIISLVLIIFFFIYKKINGISNTATFKLILLSYVFINVAYFGIKITG